MDGMGMEMDREARLDAWIWLFLLLHPKYLPR